MIDIMGVDGYQHHVFKVGEGSIGRGRLGFNPGLYLSISVAGEGVIGWGRLGEFEARAGLRDRW